MAWRDGQGRTLQLRSLGTVLDVLANAGAGIPPAGVGTAGTATVNGNTVTLTCAPNAQKALYFIEPDHLGTPRNVQNQTQQTVWRWDQAEAFGNNAPNENPSNLGAFVFPLRFPGQYADGETGLFYNYFRDYNPVVGGYWQSDPIGLAGGSLAPYAYVHNSPLRLIDSTGLWASDAHDYFIDIVFRNFDPAIRDTVKAGSYHADKPKFQKPEYAFMHGMSSKSMDPIQAQKKMCEFMKEHLQEAEDAKRQGSARYWFHLGMALHAAMDSTSPAHEGFQMWHGVFKDGSKHGPGPRSMENIDVAKQQYHTRRTTQRMREVMNGNLSGCGC